MEKKLSKERLEEIKSFVYPGRSYDCAESEALPELLSHVSAVEAERDAAWKEDRWIRDAINADPEESTFDEVERLKKDRDFYFIPWNGIKIRI